MLLGNRGGVVSVLGADLVQLFRTVDRLGKACREVLPGDVGELAAVHVVQGEGRCDLLQLGEQLWIQVAFDPDDQIGLQRSDLLDAVIVVGPDGLDVGQLVLITGGSALVEVSSMAIGVRPTSSNAPSGRVPIETTRLGAAGTVISP